MKVLHVIKTSKFESDGRLLKWIRSLELNGHDSSVFLIQDRNIRDTYFKHHVEINEERLWFRKIFKKHRGLIFKVLEQGFKWGAYFKRREVDVVVFHDLQQYLNILFAFKILRREKKKIKLVWDLHELPHSQLSSNLITRRILRSILSKMDLLVYTNEERRAYVRDTYGHNEKNYVILNNFPDESFISAAAASIPTDLGIWTQKFNNPYLLWMGAASRGRYFHVLLSAYKKFECELNLVIMGRIDNEFKDVTDRYRKEGRLFDRFVTQAEVIHYVDNALFSVVLYNAKKPNNRLCEPNRLFQLLSRNIPVITGNNPTMKVWVDRLKGGIVLEDDGKDVGALEAAIHKMTEHREDYSKNLRSLNKLELFNWTEQFTEIINFINTK